MRLLDTILGRTKPAAANLEALFALSSAAITLESDAGLVSSGQAAVCYKPAGGRFFAETQEELEMLLKPPAGGAGPGAAQAAHGEVRELSDSYGYHWVVLRDEMVEDLVNRVHMVNATLEDHGFGPQLLCSVFGFTRRDGTWGVSASGQGAGPASGAGGGGRGAAYLVYLYKRGTFYPFVPTGRDMRDNEMELRLRAQLAADLPMEEDLSRWFPLWGLPLS